MIYLDINFVWTTDIPGFEFMTVKDTFKALIITRTFKNSA